MLWLTEKRLKNGDGLKPTKDVEQRFLGRIYLKDQMDLIIRESVYHRNFREEENLKSVAIWKLDDESSGNSIR